MVKWKLGDLYNSIGEKEIKELIRVLEKETEKIEKIRPLLKNGVSAKVVIDILDSSKKTAKLTSKIGAFINLKLSEDTASHKYNALASRLEQIGTEFHNRSLFFDLWWIGLDEKNAERIIKQSGEYAHKLRSTRKFRKHTLKENEEKIINIKDLSGAGAISNLYDIITNAYTFDFKKKKGVSQAEVMENVRDKNKDVRKLAYETVLSRYGKEESLLGEIYRNIALDWVKEGLRLRGYETPISIRNKGNDLPDEAIETLLNVCKKNRKVFQDYFKLKAKVVGMKKLRRYDIYAPVKNSKTKLKYEDSVKTVLEVFGEFDTEFRDMAKRVIDEKHIHSDIQKGKRSGAFCYSVHPSITPYILMNYVGSYNDTSTLAHELGHAVHSMLASHKNIFDFHAPLPLAETASIFCEMLLEEKLLERKMSSIEREHMLVTQLDGIYASIMRQAYFVMFEKKAHEMIEKGATIGQLNDVYFKLLKEQFGDSIELPEVFKHEWKYIPHIYHTPFYCYAYAFGNLLVLSLFNMYKHEGKNFIKKYKRILSHGGGEVPSKILSEAGIDVKDENFWQGGFDLIKDMVKRLDSELK